MNTKKDLILGAIIIVIVVGIVILQSNREAKDSMIPEKSSDNMIQNRDLDISEADKSMEQVNADTMTNTAVDSEVDTDPKHFTLLDVDGNTVSLNDYKGEKVYLKFWASWCSICLAGIDEIDAFSGETKDFVVLTVVSPSYNGEQNESDFLNWYQGLELKNLQTLLDPEGSVAMPSGVRAYPTSVFIDSEGNVSKTVPGHLSKENITEMMLETK